MSLTTKEIIIEADALVPNGYVGAGAISWLSPEKIAWLNALNQEFFDVVKIPDTKTFTSVSGTTAYTLTGTIKEKNIDKVMVGTLKYRSLNYEDVQPAQNWFTFNESTNLLTLSTAPSRSSLPGLVRAYQSSTTNFTTANVVTASPDAPAEYHWIYVLGMAEYIAKANIEDAKALNYGTQYQNALAVAAQNYQKGA